MIVSKKYFRSMFISSRVWAFWWFVFQLLNGTVRTPNIIMPRIPVLFFPVTKTFTAPLKSVVESAYPNLYYLYYCYNVLWVFYYTIFFYLFVCLAFQIWIPTLFPYYLSQLFFLSFFFSSFKCVSGNIIECLLIFAMSFW